MWSSIVNGIMGAGGGLLGSLGKQQAIDDKQHGIGVRKGENQSWFNRRYNEDPTQRVDAMRILSMTEDALRRRNRAAEGRKAVMGGTEESVAAEREMAGNALSNVTSQIAAANESRKDQIEQQYLSRKNKLDDEYWDAEAERPNGYDIASNVLAGLQNGLGKGGGMNGSGISGMVSGIGKK